MEVTLARANDSRQCMLAREGHVERTENSNHVQRIRPDMQSINHRSGQTIDLGFMAIGPGLNRSWRDGMQDVVEALRCSTK